MLGLGPRHECAVRRRSNTPEMQDYEYDNDDNGTQAAVPGDAAANAARYGREISRKGY
ncbi:hypothetical protein BGC_56950 [Burkholderia sp. 3C]